MLVTTLKMSSINFFNILLHWFKVVAKEASTVSSRWIIETVTSSFMLVALIFNLSASHANISFYCNLYCIEMDKKRRTKHQQCTNAVINENIPFLVSPHQE